MRLSVCVLSVALLTACNVGRDTSTPFGSTPGPGAEDGGGGGHSDDPGGGTGDGDGDGPDDGSPDDPGEDDDGIKFDTPDGDPPGDDPGDGDGDDDGPSGCEGVDFVFVIDNSGSMIDEQQNLIASFPGFISTIQDTLDLDNYHVMVIDTDTVGSQNTSCSNGSCSCDPSPACCHEVCGWGLGSNCNGYSCANLPGDICPITLGAGKTTSGSGQSCGLLGGNRYADWGQPDLAGAFACMATVGTEGDGNERPMGSLTASISEAFNGPGGCNEGFVRNEAILVITIITDEEDNGKSQGDPTTWMQAVLDAKNGNQDGVVPLGLVGDTDLPGGICQPYNNGGGAEPAPRLREFVSLFDHGMWGSVCASDYAPFFLDAVSVIDTACDEYVPEG
jgi:hypothetical protein